MNDQTDPKVTYLNKHGYEVIAGNEKAGVYVVQDQTDPGLWGVVLTSNTIIRRDSQMPSVVSVTTSLPTSYNFTFVQLPTQILECLTTTRVLDRFVSDPPALAALMEEVDTALPYDDQVVE